VVARVEIQAEAPKLLPFASAFVTYSSTELASSQAPIWFCLKAEPKREHIAATGLRRQMRIECCSPRLRYRKMTLRGPVWFVEPMFPGYLFAQFVYSEHHRQVEYSPGIRGIVQFGDRVAALHPAVIDALQAKAGAEELVIIDSSVEIGQSARITEGPFQGLEVLVTHLLPAKERVRVLLEFLGRSIETEVSKKKVLPLIEPRWTL
jgi:transcriptional antiterminator RfaH